MKSIEISAKNVDQAIEIGLFKMEAKREDVKVVILENGGLFTKARVKLILTSENTDESLVESVVNSFMKSTGLSVYGEVVEEDERIIINLSGSDVGVLIGKRGDVLDSIQYLLSQIINKGKSHTDFKRVFIDSEGYRDKREETLRSLALRLANQALKEGKNIKLEPMSAPERRIIHTSLQSRNDIETVSKGNEPGRYITIIPLLKKSKTKKYNKNRKSDSSSLMNEDEGFVKFENQYTKQKNSPEENFVSVNTKNSYRDFND